MFLFIRKNVSLIPLKTRDYGEKNPNRKKIKNATSSKCLNVENVIFS